MVQVNKCVMTLAQEARLKNGKCVRGSLRMNPETGEVEFRAYQVTPPGTPRREFVQAHSRTLIGRYGMSFRFYFAFKGEEYLPTAMATESHWAAQMAQHYREHVDDLMN